MDYPDSNKTTQIPEVGVMRKALSPYIEEVKEELTKTVENITPEEFALVNDRLDRLAIEIGNKSNLQYQDVKKLISNEVADILKSMQKSIENNEKIIKSSQAKVDLLKYRPHDQDPDGEVFKYYGFADADGKWYIVRHDVMDKAERYATGSKDYKGAWIGRETLKYKYLYEAF